MSPRRYPRIGGPPTERHLKVDFIHSEVEVAWAEGEAPRMYCGDNWCTGRRGLAALIMPGWHPGELVKCSGPQVAAGRVLQGLRVNWNGSIEHVPEEHHADFRKRWYQ